ncbi:ABC transporter [Akanthomyces lecanii RCEF 1005]|uniref:ABC transporter n=1 Tax=Akanthomyces lecanii RCEF 1005 TaxID=1081108 RepID=A0A168CZL5_CORDF|nr:ABC transporter [Akanthomyces lecanii RCEF 1005]
MAAKCNDAAFGPVVASAACRGGFDFTVKFEESTLSILPSSLFIVVAAAQCVRLLRHKSLKVRPSLLLIAKLGTIATYSSILLAILVQKSLEVSETSQVAIASAAIGLVTAIALGVLSILEHRNTSRPSFLISIFLFLSILFDIVRTHLFGIHEKLDPHKLTQELSKQWNKSDRHRRHGLAIATLWAWKTELAKVAIPRLMVVALNISQPFIIAAIIDNTLAPDTPEIRSQGHGLIGAVALSYFATAIITGFYQHLAFRLMAMTRGGLIGLIYTKLTRSRAGAAENRDSAVITLIESDVERIAETWYLLTSHLWACILQLGLSVWLLERQIGVICIAPIILAIVFTLTSLRAAGFMTARQKLWLEAVQRRVNFTANVLSHMKQVKMLGLSDKMQQIIREFRIAEIDRSKRYRRLSSFNICLLNLPSTYGQLVTFAAFAIVARVQHSDAFTLSKAISSISILAILMEPLQQLLYCIPQISGALGCFERVQSFLNSESWCDNRLKLTGSPDQHIPAPQIDSEIELHLLPVERRHESIVVANATFGWNAATPILKGICLHLTSDTNVAMITGPVGCGKSTLLKSLLGETTIHSGSVSLSSQDVSYCDQSPWLSSGTIQSVIIGASAYRERLYKAVVYACALDTDIASLKNGDQTQIRAHGNTLSGGQKQRVAIARALFSQKPIAIFDDVLSGLDPVTRETVVTRVFGPDGLLRELGIIAILATHTTDRMDVADKIVVLDAEGRIASQGPPDIMAETSTLAAGETTATEPSAMPQSQTEVQPEEEDEAKQLLRQTGDVSVYKFYFKSLGWMNFATFALIVSCEGAFGTMLYAWISLWSNSAERNNTGYWLGLYAMWAILKGIGLFGAVYFIYVVTVPRSASHLHGSVLETAFRAPMSFISPTPTGVLVNRFSQDMRLVDMVLPGNLVSTCFILSGCLGIGALIIVASPYLAAVLPFIAGVLYLLQRFYLKTSRQLRLLELESKAPVTSHVMDTIRGTMTIRAYGWEGVHVEKLERLLADCQKPFYLLLCIQRWLGLVLGLVVGVLAVLLTTVAVTVRGSTASAGFVGVALVNMMSLSQTLVGLIEQWTNLETSLGAVSRIKSFSEETPQEVEPEGRLEAEWPGNGAVLFDNWTAGYADTMVLHGINMDMKPGQKVALCGRTGSGKSSLVTSILGMVDGTAGRIVIDGVDLATVSGETVRKAVTCVTQDPFFFDGSVRDNLDPARGSTMAGIEAALRRVGLWPVVSKAALDNGLPEDQVLNLAAEELHLSHGQSQLFCLARAMLRDSRVVLLDEPTSSVDSATEQQIQDIVEREFKQSTVVMVTHRLSGIRRFDRVAVLKAGELAEYGPPDELLADGESALSVLYEAQGRGNGPSENVSDSA